MQDNKEKSPLPPHQVDHRYDHRWGFDDTAFRLTDNGEAILTGNRYHLCGYPIPGLIPYLEKELEFKVEPEHRQQENQQKPVPEPQLNQAFFQQIQQSFSEHQYTLDDKERLIHSHGQTSADEIYKVLYYEGLVRTVDLVFYPEKEEDVKTCIDLAYEHNVCVVPYGGGTNVSGALVCPPEEKRMIVSVDMRRMNKILWIDKENYRACIEAGISGRDLEAKLLEKGFVLGHEPDSLEFSTLGGWISTNASGMKKNRYGNIEDIVEDITMITPTGTMESKIVSPRNSMGIQPHFLLFGSEGNLGIITKAIVKIHERPEKREYASIVFPHFREGVDFMYHLRHHGLLPASIRLVDNTQFRFGLSLKPRPGLLKKIMDKIKKFYLIKGLGFHPNKMTVCTILMEGNSLEVAQQKKSVFKTAKKFGGISGGAENGKRGYMLTFAIAYMRDFFSRYHVIGETFETSVPWSRVDQVCEAVVQKAHEKHKDFSLPGKPYVSYRLTQTYHTGACIYFIYAFYHKGVKEPHKVFHQIEHELRKTVLANGGSLSHHHGVGKIRQDFLPDVLSQSSLQSLRDLKKSIDPKNIFAIQNGAFKVSNKDDV